MSNASNSNGPVPNRRSAFNMKGLRQGVSERYVRQVFRELLPGSHVCTWEEKRGKKTRRVGRISITEEVMRAYPEFQESLKRPGKDIALEVGPFELMIWCKKPKKIRMTMRDMQEQLKIMKEELVEHKRYNQQTQAMLNHLLEPGNNNIKEVSFRKKRPPKQSPVHKRMKIIENEEMNVEPKMQAPKAQNGIEKLMHALNSFESNRVVPQKVNHRAIARLDAQIKLLEKESVT